MNTPLNLIDGYKADHRSQYPKGTELVFSNFTPRSSRVPGSDHVVVFGTQYFVQEYLIKKFNFEFFMRSRSKAVAEYKRRMDYYLGKDAISTQHIDALHRLGYLPIHIMALPEGTVSPIGVPVLVMWNTKPEFFWLTNYLETLMSCCMWGPITSATTALRYKKVLSGWAEKTSSNPSFVDFQAHDFSMRGMFGVEAATMSGAAHLTSFVGTDCVPAIDMLEQHYGANAEKEMVGVSVPASEHAVMCMGGQEDEIGTFRRFITETYPKGIVSVVSDTWDFWKVVTEYLPVLKDIIMDRDGKLVIRPDSGDPADILCGMNSYTPEDWSGGPIPERKGLIECLWDIFGGTVNEKGYKELDPHIGAIYGDSITVERAEAICARLAAKGFASTNVVFGVGSYTYQYVTRDTYGMAMKATYGVVNGEPREIFKSPKTDSGTKKSAKGLLAVKRDEQGELYLQQSATWQDVLTCEFVTVFCDGVQVNETTLEEIRTNINKSL